MELELFEAFIVALGAIGFGTILLVKGGDWTVDSSVTVAERFGISPLMIGFTVLAFGTSLPELIVSVLANLQGAPGIAIGNVLGSNIANIALVLATGALIAPLAVISKAVKRDLLFMLFATVIFAGLLHYGTIGAGAGFSMILLLIAYVFYQYRSAKKTLQIEGSMENIAKPSDKDFYMALVFLMCGLAGIAIGAEFLVRGARIGAEAIGVPDAVIALSLIALGTSLPELSTSIIAARKGHGDMVLGNIVGSNVFNILFIMGTASLVKPILAADFAPQLVNFDIWVTMAVSVVLAGLLFITGKMGRIAGALFISGYVAYNVYIYAMYMGG